MTEAAAKTAIGPTALIAVEQYYPENQRIVDDSIAYQMLPLSSKIFVSLLRPLWMRNWIISLSEKSQPGIWGGLLCRKRFIDDKLKAYANDVERVVNIGAGFDTRCFRLPSVSKIPIWEIDQEENIRAKEIGLHKVLGQIPSNVRLLSIDFDNEDVTTSLKREGYSVNKKTFFIMEAVTQYLLRDSVIRTFSFLKDAALGSLLTFTYVRKDFIEGKNLYGWESGYKRFVKSNIWHYGINPNELAGFLKDYGWRVIEDKGYDELAEEYLKVSGRKLTSTPVERMVYAEKVLS